MILNVNFYYFVLSEKFTICSRDIWTRSVILIRKLIDDIIVFVFAFDSYRLYRSLIKLLKLSHIISTRSDFSGELWLFKEKLKAAIQIRPLFRFSDLCLCPRRMKTVYSKSLNSNLKIRSRTESYTTCRYVVH